VRRHLERKEDPSCSDVSTGPKLVNTIFSVCFTGPAKEETSSHSRAYWHDPSILILTAPDRSREWTREAKRLWAGV
jgi:hypothetical protein